MSLDNQKIDWSSSGVLMQIVKSIETPLESIIEASDMHSRLDNNKFLKDKSTDIIFSNSQEIKRLIDEVLKNMNGGRILEEEPIIFQIYQSNERVQSMCKEKINPRRISKQDISWLKKMESEIYKSIKYKDLSLYDLSYKMSVSERQLHRKIKSLVHLTPNKYIRVLKLHKAKQFIDEYLYDTISQVSYAVGYYDAHYFSKLFLNQYGVTPKKLILSNR